MVHHAAVVRSSAAVAAGGLTRWYGAVINDRRVRLWVCATYALLPVLLGGTNQGRLALSVSAPSAYHYWLWRLAHYCCAGPEPRRLGVAAGVPA